MIFASYFRRPLPRWADEGGATSVEHISEKQKHRQMLVQFLRTGRGIAFGQMFAMTEYPQDVMPLYAQGYSLAEFLIYHGGRKKFVAFLADGMRDGQWSAAVERNYNISDLSALQNTWVAWVGQGFPAPPAESNVMTAAAQRRPRCTPVAAVADAASRPAGAEPDLSHPRQGRSRTSAAGSGGTQTLARPTEHRCRRPAKTRRKTLRRLLCRRRFPRRAGGRPAAHRPRARRQPSQATTSQVARPPTMEPSRQVILEWQQH